MAIAVLERAGTPRALRDAATGADLRLAGFEDLDADLLARHRPSLVLSWALQGRHDAPEIARRLERPGFRGRYVAPAPARALPRPDLVRAAVARACPSLRVEILALPTAPALLRAV